MQFGHKAFYTLDIISNQYNYQFSGEKLSVKLESNFPVG